MMSEPSFGLLSDIAISHSQTVNPKSLDEEVVEHYSLPAWSKLEPETIAPSKLKSNKLALPNECVLVSKLNPKRHKTWRVSTNSSKVALASTEWAVLTPKHESISIDYLYAVVTEESFQNHLKARITGTSSSHQRVRLPDILSSPIPRFELEMEKKIGSLIAAIRTLLKLKLSQHKLLEDYCESLFKSWFIDFTPVHEPRGEQNSSKDQNSITSHFPNELQQSPIGNIPVGWEFCPLGELITISRGLSYNAAHLCEEGGVPFHTANSVLEGGGYKFSGIKYYSGEYSEKHLIEPNDIIVATLEQSFDHALVGHVARIPTIYGNENIYSGDLFKVSTIDDRVSKNWIYSLLKSEKMHKQIIQYSNGTTINRIPQDSLKRPVIAVPPRKVIDLFDNIVAPIHALCDQNIATIHRLLGAQENLLPLLLSGEINTRKLR